MDIDRLRYFSLIAETGSIRRAAEYLRLSPPALSKALKLLEAEVGTPLVVHSGRGILITDHGKLLASKARKLLTELDALRELTPSPAAQGDKPVRIGSFEVFTTYFLGALVERHLNDRPIEIHELVPGHLERALLDRQIDVGITYIPLPSGELEQIKLTQIEMGIFARKGRFAGEDIHRIPFVVPALPIGGTPDRVRGSDGWPEAAFPRTVRFQVTLMESAIELCRVGEAAAYLPRFVARLHNERMKSEHQLSEIPFPEDTPRGAAQWVYLMKRKADVEDATFRKLAKAVRVECGKGARA
ncbi:MAG TPA: LysR family transcriptional regulator [Bdellovibrionota bacterium]|nr:LysR family transcriptional regulator [Bdellovibrionota bacterium]